MLTRVIDSVIRSLWDRAGVETESVGSVIPGCFDRPVDNVLMRSEILIHARAPTPN
jgi:hypothetical protein